MPTAFDRSHPLYPPTLGARLVTQGGCQFRVWASKAKRVELILKEEPARPIQMQPESDGYWTAYVADAKAGLRYSYRLDGGVDRPDPASHFQPEGVHQSSAVVDHKFDWTDSSWNGRSRHDLVIYELHIGTFSPTGTFEAAISYLDELVELGITAIELMPVAQFPGGRNWGYDGVHLFAPQNTYGGPDGLKRFVNACHQRGLAVILDVVFNHLGPEGNYLGEFAHYFTGRYRTPWGDALNFDGKRSDEVRRFFIENALLWFSDYHIDGLRLDAVHAIFDQSARPFLQDLADVTTELAELQNRRLILIAESNLNDPRLVRPKAVGGCGLDAQWVDDFHHALHVTLTGEQAGYYSDFIGVRDLIKSLRNGYVFSGQSSNYRGKHHGVCEPQLEPQQIVIAAQNHDQTGNRCFGERLSQLVDFESLKLAAGLVCLSPYMPLLFMGEEYGETSPFLYFVSHSDPNLVAAVRRGRKRDFAHFEWQQDPPDPQDENTFNASCLQHQQKSKQPHQSLRDLYQTLLRLRRELPALQTRRRESIEVLDWHEVGCFALRYRAAMSEVLVLFNTAKEPTTCTVDGIERALHCILDSTHERWAGPNECPSPHIVESAQRAEFKLPSRAFLIYATPN